MASRRWLWVALATVVVGAGVFVSTRVVHAERANCIMPTEPLRYRDVAPIFAKHCNSCHDKRISDNTAAQRVFESSRYPFSTERPNTLLADLHEMFDARRSLSDAERCRALAWLATGARDDRGRAPPYKSHR